MTGPGTRPRYVVFSEEFRDPECGFERCWCSDWIQEDRDRRDTVMKSMKIRIGNTSESFPIHFQTSGSKETTLANLSRAGKAGISLTPVSQGGASDREPRRCEAEDKINRLTSRNKILP